MLACGLYTKSKSPLASRPHIARKPPHDTPKDVDIKDCGLRVCGDYRRRPNDQLQKSFPSTANGTDESAKLPGYSYYWITDRFSMYNAYALRPTPYALLAPPVNSSQSTPLSDSSNPPAWCLEK